MQSFYDEWAEYGGNWDDYTANYGLPYNFSDTIERLLEGGLNLAELKRYIGIAMTANVGRKQVWRYFCGCCWRELTHRQELARRLIEDEEV